MYPVFKSKYSIVPSIMLILTACSGCKEIQQKHFANLADAQQEHMVEKSWIPSFVSADARDINFTEDLDMASVYGDYLSDDTSLLRKNCPNAEASFQIVGFGPKWFRDDVKEADTAGVLRQKGYEVLRCPDGFSVVISSSRRYVAYWYARKS